MHTHSLTVSSVFLLLFFFFLCRIWLIFGRRFASIPHFWWAHFIVRLISTCSMACCAHFFLSNYLSSFSPLALSLSIVYNKYRLRCKGKTGPAVYICVCCVCELFCLFCWVSLISFRVCVVLLCVLSALYINVSSDERLELRLQTPTQRTSAWNPVSFSIFF